jgi:DNA polymerase III subunit gamma/tau
MAGQALYRKWRSQTFEQVVGQEHITLTLRNALREGRLSHAYLFTGPRGTGKTSTARILAKAINCLAEDPAARPCNQCTVCIGITEGRQLDLIEIDAASNRGIDEIRDLREKIGFRPSEARYKVYIIDEVHMLTKEAFNALLKTLEEPPAHAVFVLATTEPDRVPETVRSRCQRFDFRRVPVRLVAEHLAEITQAEGAQVAPEALQAIARRSTGCMRDAISLLDQLLSYGDEVVGLARVESVLGLVDAQTIAQLVDAMIGHDAASGLTLINKLVANGIELGELVDQILAYLRAVLFAQLVRAADALDLPEETAAAVMRQAETLAPAAILSAIREFSEARGALRDQVPGVPQLPIELAFVRAALPQAAAPTFTAAPPVTVTSTMAPPMTAAAAQTGAPVAPPARQTQPEAKPATGATAASPATPAGAKATSADAPDEQLLISVRQNWDQFLAVVGKRCGMQVQAALRSARALDVAGHTLTLQFAHDFARKVVDDPERRAQVETVWEEVVGSRIHVRCTVAGGSAAGGSTAGDNAAPSAAGSAAARPAAGNKAGESDDDVLLHDARNRGASVKRL